MKKWLKIIRTLELASLNAGTSKIGFYTTSEPMLFDADLLENDEFVKMLNNLLTNDPAQYFKLSIIER